MSNRPDSRPATAADLRRVPAPLVAELIGGQLRTRRRPGHATLYARLGVPWLWLVNPHDQLRGSAVGDDPVQLPPFDAVPLALAALWRW